VDWVDNKPLFNPISSTHLMEKKEQQNKNKSRKKYFGRKGLCLFMLSSGSLLDV